MPSSSSHSTTPHFCHISVIHCNIHPNLSRLHWHIIFWLAPHYPLLPYSMHYTIHELRHTSATTTISILPPMGFLDISLIFSALLLYQLLPPFYLQTYQTIYMYPSLYLITCDHVYLFSTITSTTISIRYNHPHTVASFIHIMCLTTTSLSLKYSRNCHTLPWSF